MKLPEYTIIREKGMGKKYYSSKIRTVEYRNFPEGQEWVSHLFFQRHKEPIAMRLRLFEDNRKSFREIFGKPSFCFAGSHYFHAWYIRLPHIDFIILTAREHGTGYEVVTHKDGLKIQPDIQEMLAFMDSLKYLLPEIILDFPINP
jgi:hypothetical protein